MKITKNKTMTIACVSIALLACIIVGIWQFSKNSESGSSVNTVGNTAGNLSNGGYAAIQGDWIYFSNPNDDDKLYRMKADGSNKKKLSDDTVSSINVVGDWIYYIYDEIDDDDFYIEDEDEYEDEDYFEYEELVASDDEILTESVSHIFAIKTNGKDKKELSGFDGIIYCLAVANDTIYYTYTPNPDELCNIYSMNLDGSNRKKLNDDDTYYFSLYGESIYYISDGSIYSMTTDGSEYKKVELPPNYMATEFELHDGRIYYCWEEEFDDDTYTAGLSSMNIDGSDDKFLSDDEAYNLIMVEGGLYYVDYEEDGGIIFVDSQGDNRKEINDEVVLYFNIAGDLFMFTSWNEELEEDEFYVMRLDGSGKLRIK